MLTSQEPPTPFPFPSRVWDNEAQEPSLSREWIESNWKRLSGTSVTKNWGFLYPFSSLSLSAWLLASASFFLGVSSVASGLSLGIVMSQFSRQVFSVRLRHQETLEDSLWAWFWPQNTDKDVSWTWQLQQPVFLTVWNPRSDIKAFSESKQQLSPLPQLPAQAVAFYIVIAEIVMRKERQAETVKPRWDGHAILSSASTTSSTNKVNAPEGIV